MSRKLSDEDILYAIRKSIDNYNHLLEVNSQKRGVNYKIKYICWFIMCIFLAPRYKVHSDKFVAMINPIGEKKLMPYTDSGECFKFAKLNDSLKKLKNNINVLSPFTIWERGKILLTSVCFFCKYRRELKGYIHFVMEYYAIAEFFNRFEIKEIIFQGIYDRYNTLISYIGYLGNISITGVQDGACVIDKVPAKIHCNQMYCFDEFEAEQLKNYIWEKDCIYKYVGFQSVIKWDEFRIEKKMIAIASQDWYTEKTINFIEKLMLNPKSKGYSIIIFPHYREYEEQYADVLKHYPDLIFARKNRYCNINVLVTFFSTIVYDFWSVNKDLEIVCMHVPGFEPAYYRRENVHITETYDEAIDKCFTILEKNKCSD